MNKRRLTLSIADQKAVDVFLDHTAGADQPRLTRLMEPVAPRRLSAASDVLSLLAEMPASDPPAGLVERTLQRIDHHVAQKIGRRNSVVQSNTAQIH